MGQARRLAEIALAGMVMASLLLSAVGPARAAQEVVGWDVEGSVEAGGIYSFGERGSSKFNQYRDMDNGFVGDLTLRGEKKDSPYFFGIFLKNPARDDQLYEGGFGRFGLYQLDLGWNRTPHVLSNSAATIYQQREDIFSLPGTQRAAIAAVFSGTGGNPAPNTPAGATNINNTINGLLRPVDLGFNTDVGNAALKFTPTADLRFDLEYASIRRDGKRPIGAEMAGGTSGPLDELAIPLDNWTNEVKFGTEYARSDWGLQFNYIGSFFSNGFKGYTWDNPVTATNTAAANATGRFAAAPNNMAHTLSLTGTAALPLRSRVNGTFAYTMLRQDQTFLNSTENPLLNRRNTDDAGNSSPDAQANLVLGNIVLTSRPITSRVAGLDTTTFTARYRYFEYQNPTDQHTFTNVLYVGGGTTVGSDSTVRERYTKQNAGFDIGWHPITMLNLKLGYEFEHWSRADYADFGDTGATHPNFSNHEHIGKAAVDVTPFDWLLGRVTYSYGDRYIVGYNVIPTTDLAGSVKYPYADRKRHRVDGLFQFSPWETFTPSINGGYAADNFPNNNFGLTKGDYFYGGVDLDWSPVKWLTISGNYTYEQYNWDMSSRYLVGGVFPGSPFNNWRSRSTDEFHNVGVNAVVDIIPKKFDVTLGYMVTFGYTTFENFNPDLNSGGVTNIPQATTFNWDKVLNVLQTFRIMGRYRLTEKLSVRGGFAYERYNERDFARDPMQPFMGFFASDRPGGALQTGADQSVFLGATVPNYESYTFAGFVRYDF